MFVLFSCGHTQLHIRATIEVSWEYAGLGQRNGTSLVFMRYVDFEIQ